jgi:hypothetical protein
MHGVFSGGEATPVGAHSVGVEVLVLVGAGCALSDQPADALFWVLRIRLIGHSLCLVGLFARQP